MEKLTFEEWCKGVDAEHIKYGGGDESYTDTCGPDCWKDYYDEGYTPEEAYSEDCSAGH